MELIACCLSGVREEGADGVGLGLGGVDAAILCFGFGDVVDDDGEFRLVVGLGA